MHPTRRDFLKLTAAGAAGLFPATATLRAAAGDESEAFLAAVVEGDLARVRGLLDAAPGLLRATDPLGRSAFALAHLHGHVGVGEHLASRGYAPDLHEAALAGDWERFDTLAAADPAAVRGDHPIGGTVMFAAAIGGAGADMWRPYAVAGDPDEVPRGVEGVSPVQAALGFRDLATAEVTAAMLLGNDADPNPPHRGDDPPLHIAARRGSTELVEMLIRLGAAVDARDREGRSPREAAESAGQEATAALLAGHAEIPRTHSSSRTAYDASGGPYAAPEIGDIPLADRMRFVGQSHGNPDFVRDAVSAEGRLAHSVATTGEICVEACAHTGRREIVEVLLDRGAPYSLPTAVMRDDRRRVAELLDEDPLRIHERGAHDFALLWYPVIGRCGVEAVELLLARGAEVERQHHLGTTALHWACLRGELEIAELLIAHGADVHRRGRKFDPAGETPLDCARKNDHQEVARMLVARGATA